MLRTLALVVMSAGTLAGAQPPGPPVCDLDVLHIQRTPRFPGYEPRYDLPGRKDQPLLVRAATGATPMVVAPPDPDPQQRWPEAGQEVTFGAIIENKGRADVPPFEYVWRLDGREVARGRTEAALPPGARVTLTYTWPWEQERHELVFEADPMRRVRQFAFANDRRAVWTHAKLLICYVDRVTYDEFAAARNFAGTYSFEDWCQAHADWMNVLFERSRYAKTAPEGILERVAVDHIGVLDDERARDARWHDSSPLREGWDGGWWFGRNTDAARWAAGMDWGLIHEWGHQLGLTDLYALDVAPETNLIADAGGAPLLIGHLSVFHDTMMHGHGPVIFSEDQAIALNHQLWRRRGYYGDYYYHLAEHNFVRVRGADGRPVPDARLRFWQRGAGGFHGEPTFTGTTGPDGRCALPNRPAPDVATYGTAGSGYRLKPNPFGLIHVVGGNGVFFIEIQARGQTEHAFLEITQLNLARAQQGSAEATVDLATQLPAEGAARPPPPPSAEAVRQEVQLTLAGAERWVLLRADPTEYAWKRVAVVSGETFRDTLPRSGLFRYAAALETGGRLSARSAPVGVAAMTEPWGLALAPDGTVYVRDRANGQTLVVRRDGSAVGYVGSVHWHLEGSYDHAADARGLLYVAKWPDGYDPQRSWIRQIDPRGLGREHDRKDMAGGETTSAAPGRFKQPMGIWVCPDTGRIVVADTGNDRVQVLDADGQPDPARTVSGLRQPHKALLVGERLVVCDTGAQRVRVYAWQSGGWTESAALDGFEQPTYGCTGPGDDVLIADRGSGRIFALDVLRGRRLEWQFPPGGAARLADLRGIAYDRQHGELWLLDGGRLVRRHIQD